jgi:hypothetical protein
MATISSFAPATSPFQFDTLRDHGARRDPGAKRASVSTAIAAVHFTRQLPVRIITLATVRAPHPIAAGSGAARRLIGVLAPCNLETGQQNDPQIEPQGPVIDVPDVALDALLHKIKFSSFAAKTVNLRPTGDTGLHVVPKCIVRYRFVVLTVMSDCVRPWANKRHFTP